MRGLSLSRQQFDHWPCAGRFRETEERLHTWQLGATFKSCNNGLSSVHPRCEFGLRQASSNSRCYQFTRQTKFICHCVVIRADLAIREHLLSHRLQTLCHKTISAIRFSANSMERRGVFCAFLTNTWSTIRRRPETAVYIARPIPSRPCNLISQSFSPSGRTCGRPTWCGPKVSSNSEILRNRACMSLGRARSSPSTNPFTTSTAHSATSSQ